jgi:hypothetical protein
MAHGGMALHIHQHWLGPVLGLVATLIIADGFGLCGENELSIHPYVN